MGIKDVIVKFKKHRHPVMPQELLCMEGMAERNAARIEAIKQEMGTRWILHPSHTKTRLDEPRPV